MEAATAYDACGTLVGPVKVEPLAGLSFSLDANTSAAAGEALTVRPRLTLGSLSIVTCYRGAAHGPYSMGGTGAMLRLLDKDGKALEHAQSGFA